MPVVHLKYRRIDGVTPDGALVTSGLVEVVPAYRRDTGSGQMTTIGDTYPVGSSITLAGDTYLFKLRASDGKGGRLKDEGVYRLVPPTGGPYDVDDLTEVTPAASGMTLSDVQALITAAMAGITPGPGGTPTGSGPGGLFYSVDVKDTSAVGRSVMTAVDAAAARTAISAPAVSDLTSKADLASPAFTGNPTAPTQTAGNNSTRVATTAYVDTGLGGKVSATSPTISNPTVTGTADLVNLDVSGSAVFAAGSIAQAAVANLATDLAAKVGASSPTITGTADFVNIDVSGTVVIPNASLTVAKLSDIVTYLATTWGEIPTIYATNATTWPATRTVPSGYSGAVRWDSTAFDDAVSPTAMVTGDRWRRRQPTA